jgi:hypothetical protein
VAAWLQKSRAGAHESAFGCRTLDTVRINARWPKHDVPGNMGGAPMGNFQAFLLGIMVALTPSLIAVAFFLWRTPLIDDVCMGGESRKRPHSRRVIEGGARRPGISSF